MALNFGGLLKDATSFGKRVFSAMSAVHGTKITVGFGGETYPDGTLVADVAMMMEHGTSTVPPRPFIQQAIKRNQKKIRADLLKMGVAICKGESVDGEIEKMQKDLEGIFAEEIDKGNFASNAESTVKRKGSSQPLVDTGLLKKSVKTSVTKKG